MTRKQAIEKTENLLNTIDILSYARRGESLVSLMDRLDAAYAEVEEVQKEPFDTYLFNWMDEDEFMDYLKRRYGKVFSFQEAITYYYTRDKL